MKHGYELNISGGSKPKTSRQNNEQREAFYEMLPLSPDNIYNEYETVSIRRNSASACNNNNHINNISGGNDKLFKQNRFSVVYNSTCDEATPLDISKLKDEISELEVINESLIANSPCVNITRSYYSMGDLRDCKINSDNNNLKNYKRNLLTWNFKFAKIVKTMQDFLKPPFLERLIRKNGNANINRTNLQSRSLRYFNDLFNTIIDMGWHYILIVFILSFLVSWTLFAVIWFSIDDGNGKSCIEKGVNRTWEDRRFLSALLFSIETQQTIGYGSRFVNDDCGFAVVVLMLQCFFSVILESMMGGIVFAKLSKPKKSTLLYLFRTIRFYVYITERV
jgi:hypothetical protein